MLILEAGMHAGASRLMKELRWFENEFSETKISRVRVRGNGDPLLPQPLRNYETKERDEERCVHRV